MTEIKLNQEALMNELKTFFKLLNLNYSNKDSIHKLELNLGENLEKNFQNKKVEFDLSNYINNFLSSSTNVEIVAFLKNINTNAIELNNIDKDIVDIINELLQTDQNFKQANIANDFLKNLYKLQVQILLLKIKNFYKLPTLKTEEIINNPLKPTKQNDITIKYRELLKALTKKFELLTVELGKKNDTFNDSFMKHNKEVEKFENDLAKDGYNKKITEVFSKQNAKILTPISTTKPDLVISPSAPPLPTNSTQKMANSTQVMVGGNSINYKYKYQKYKSKYNQLKNN